MYSTTKDLPRGRGSGTVARLRAALGMFGAGMDQARSTPTLKPAPAANDEAAQGDAPIEGRCPQLVDHVRVAPEVWARVAQQRRSRTPGH
ncbi:hypothetical protein SAMN04489717_5197 [Actinopolymorpha singaporensis]|uniref:Uncharacterized protein n=1 Tax=Actinopolymorpha singaporensis TaxID=117157 RepID=A0A1H1XYD1_9ACTN|nr:hypothetical protein SAMN04489717_5197 [Actinopolymorpha singaporensis]